MRLTTLYSSTGTQPPMPEKVKCCSGGKRGIRYSSDMTKAEMYDLIKMHKPQYETFAIDCLLAEHGHSAQTTALPP